ncbi:hypothetical protein SCP_0109230 [Sparassis crispa]|uniref:Uncharacterized protein n=1 Tax=Sparassis crispa TaxID=139825 RepID=A0A401G794_9APHY|nr:hypothetical protein SCP_0109230 [Sparassis crispa]GBE78041.1 hypothetical protein SCP_0109230 [Sparassis crispa]
MVLVYLPCLETSATDEYVLEVQRPEFNFANAGSTEMPATDEYVLEVQRPEFNPANAGSTEMPATDEYVLEVQRPEFNPANAGSTEMPATDEYVLEVQRPEFNPANAGSTEMPATDEYVLEVQRPEFNPANAGSTEMPATDEYVLEVQRPEFNPASAGSTGQQIYHTSGAAIHAYPQPSYPHAFAPQEHDPHSLSMIQGFRGVVNFTHPIPGPTSNPGAAPSTFQPFANAAAVYGTTPDASPVISRQQTPARSPTVPYRQPPGVNPMIPPSNPVASPFTRSSSVSASTLLLSLSRSASISSSTPEVQTLAPTYDHSTIASFPHSSIQQAQLYDAPESEFAAMIQSMQHEQQNLSTHLKLMYTEFHGMATRVNTLEKDYADHLASCMAIQEAASKEKAKGSSVPMLANDHPQMKSLIHMMVWSLLAITEKNFDSLGRHKPLDNGRDYVEQEDHTKIWHPQWLAHMDNATNKRFIKAVTTQVYDNEKCIRDAGDSGNMPTASFDLEKMKSLVQDYLANLAVRYKEQQTLEGCTNRDKRNVSGQHRSKRSTKTKNCRHMAHVFEKMHNVTGALTLLNTDFASSVHEIDDAKASDDTKKRRKDQGCATNGSAVISHQWRRKRYVMYLRYLDHLLQLEAECKLLTHPTVAAMRMADDAVASTTLAVVDITGSGTSAVGAEESTSVTGAHKRK